MNLDTNLSNSPVQYVGTMRRERGVDLCALTILLNTEAAGIENHWHDNFGTDENSYLSKDLDPRRRQTFRLGRIASRRSLQILDAEPSSQRGIGVGIFGQPVSYDCNFSVSIAHTERIATAIAFPRGHPMAIDLENIQVESLQAIQSTLTQEERALMNEEPDDFLDLNFLLWSARESLSKVLQCGLMCSNQVLALNSICKTGQRSWSGEYKHFHQWAFDAWKWQGHIMSITRPKHTQLTWSLATQTA